MRYFLSTRCSAAVRLLAIGWLLGVALVSPLAAENPVPGWNRRLREAEDRLERGEAAKALKIAQGVLGDFLEVAGPGKAVEEYLGTILVLRSLAELSLGRAEDARWTWDLAANFVPDITSLDLGRFGEAGRVLQAYEIERRAKDVEDRKRLAEREASPEVHGQITAPRVLRRVPPKYPHGAKYFRSEGHVQVEVIIRSDGSVRHPVVLEKLPSPSLSYYALEAVRQWRFEPARLDGKPVGVYYRLDLNFDLR